MMPECFYFWTYFLLLYKYSIATVQYNEQNVVFFLMCHRMWFRMYIENNSVLLKGKS